MPRGASRAPTDRDSLSVSMRLLDLRPPLRPGPTVANGSSQTRGVFAMNRKPVCRSLHVLRYSFVLLAAGCLGGALDDQPTYSEVTSAATTSLVRVPGA